MRSGLSKTEPRPLLRLLHADSRWDVFLRKMGMADYKAYARAAMRPSTSRARESKRLVICSICSENEVLAPPVFAPTTGASDDVRRTAHN